MSTAQAAELVKLHEEWAGRFISPDRPGIDAPLLRKEVDIEADHGAVVEARMLLSALGVVEASLFLVPQNN